MKQIFILIPPHQTHSHHIHLDYCLAHSHQLGSPQGVNLYVARQRVMQEWESQGKLEPLVTREDVRLASQNVVPSVSMQELLKYEALRQKYSRNVK